MKKLVAIGGGEITKWNFQTKDNQQERYETKEIDKEIVRLSNQENPKLLFIGTASKENPYYFRAISRIYTNLNCMVKELKILNTKVTQDEIKDQILNTDIIYIGGGYTRYMLKQWKKYNIQEFLRQAYETGIVMAGYSAGSYGMFEYNYELIQGMNFIPAINCVHYNEKSEKKKQEFKKNILIKKKIGIALENGTALEIVGEQYRMIKSIDEAKAYKIVKGVEQELEFSNFLKLQDLLKENR